MIYRRSPRRCGTPTTSPVSSSPWRSSRRCSFAGGRGRDRQLSCAIHEAVAKCTEVDLMSWVMRHVLVLRQTCRHARETVSPFPSIVHTKDGRWVMANLGTRPGDVARLIALSNVTAWRQPQRRAIAAPQEDGSFRHRA